MPIQQRDLPSASSCRLRVRGTPHRRDSPQRRVVRVEGAQHRVDLALRVAHSHLEDPRYMVEHDAALALRGGNLHEHPLGQEGAQHGGFFWVGDVVVNGLGGRRRSFAAARSTSG